MSEEVIDWEALRRQREEHRRTVESLLRPLDKATLVTLLAEEWEWNTNLKNLKDQISVARAGVRREAARKLVDEINTKMGQLPPRKRLVMIDEKLAALAAADAADEAYLKALDRQAGRGK